MTGLIFIALIAFIYGLKYVSIRKYDSYFDIVDKQAALVIDKNPLYITVSYMNDCPIKVNIIKFMFRFSMI